MKHLIILASAVIHLLYVPLHAQLLDPVEFDGSQAIEMEVKWSLQTGETSSCTYVQDLGGVRNNNMVFFHLGNQRKIWKTYPVLDTQNVFTNWPEGVSGGPIEFDYDGAPPPEYLTGNGMVIRFDGDNSGIEVLDTITPRFQDRFVSDVNADGYRDVVYRSYNRDRWFIVIFAGPDMGRGMERALELPRYFSNEEPLRDRQAMRLMRCGDGQLRVVYCGTPRRGQSGIWLLDVHLEKRDTGWSVAYTVADSIVQGYSHNNANPQEPRVVWPVTCVDDPNTLRQWAIVNWQQGYHRAGETTVLYEVTNGKLEERMVHKGPLIPSGLSVQIFEGTFDNGEAIINYGKNQNYQFARISQPHKPFARHNSKIGAFQVFIDDQYDDGSRDIFATTSSGGGIALVNFDLRPSSVAPPIQADTMWARLQGNHLLVQLTLPATLAVDAVYPDGRSMPLHRQPLPPGEHRVDMTAKLRALPLGATFLRVTDGRRVATIPHLK
jgi:hypothetical protein